ncbi:unnamed protein product [Trichobilharzia szidati]|nr:unnamed protein product [Trichobilharzia szidati]CAH8875929.1 unnamed protein product [Trichobilharzia szidati]
MLLINKVLTLWTICCILLFSQTSQSNGIIINNWLIVLIPMCFVDFILLITSLLFMSGRPPQIFGDYDAGSKLNRTLIVSFMLWKLAGQTVVCLYLEGYVDGSSYNGFRQLQPGDPPARHRLVFSVFPLWTTMLMCLLAVCSQIVNSRSTTIWAFCTNEQASECH